MNSRVGAPGHVAAREVLAGRGARGHEPACPRTGGRRPRRVWPEPWVHGFTVRAARARGLGPEKTGRPPRRDPVRAASDDLIPAWPGWRERSRFFDRFGPIDYYQCRFEAQALPKVGRGHGQDDSDMRELGGLAPIRATRLAERLESIESTPVRHPAAHSRSFRDPVLRAPLAIV